LLLYGDVIDTKYLLLGVKAEKAYAASGVIPDPDSTDNAEFKIVLSLLARELVKDPTRWQRCAARIIGVSEETTTGVHRYFYYNLVNFHYY
jgi:adenosylhomocysteinase